MKKQVGIVLMILAAGICAKAQNDRDAFRYAQYSPTGTARYSALAGSMGAFGSDFSCLSAGNPAGIGLFKRFEFTFTPSFSTDRVASFYNGEEHSMAKSDFFYLNNLGFVFVGKADTATGWRTTQFATGLNNLARYNNGLSVVAGQNEGMTSFCDYLAAIANGTSTTALKKYDKDASPMRFAYEAWNAYLIDDYPQDEYESRVDADFNQKQVRNTDGYLNEYVFSWGGNYNDKLFLGATVGIPFFKYSQRTTYTESRNPYYDTLIVFDEFSSRATGVNLKLGIIYQPLKYLRLGAAFHTPTVYPNVKETYRNSFDVWNIIDSVTDITSDIDDMHYNYWLRTPYHAIGSIAFIYKNRGFINIDYEYVDYTVSELRAKQASDYTFSYENACINDYYKGSHIVRIGGELNLSPLVLRAGYAYSSDPYREYVEKDGSRHIISAGIGIKKRTFFADFAYMYRFSKDADKFYDHSSLNPYTMDITNQLFALTIGWKIRM